MFVLKLTLSILWGIVWAAGGVLLCMTIVWSPIGMIMLVVSGMPLAVTIRNKINAYTEWQYRERVMDNDQEKPWVM